MIEKMTLEHPVRQVAELLYQTDDNIFPFLFGNMRIGVQRMSRLIVQANNCFSYQHVHLAMGDEVQGVILEHDACAKNHDFLAFLRAFGFFGLLGLAFRTLMLAPLTLRKVKTGRYIQCLCVSPTFRGKGMGSSLLNDAIHRATRDGIPHLVLDVSVNNGSAIRLYEKFGFATEITRTSWSHRKKQMRMIKHLPHVSSL